MRLKPAGSSIGSNSKPLLISWRRRGAAIQPSANTDTAAPRITARRLFRFFGSDVVARRSIIIQSRHDAIFPLVHALDGWPSALDKRQYSMELRAIRSPRTRRPAKPQGRWSISVTASSFIPCLSGCHPHPLYVWCGVKLPGRRTKPGWMFCSAMTFRFRGSFASSGDFSRTTRPVPGDSEHPKCRECG